jgi:hypothetical protein
VATVCVEPIALDFEANPAVQDQLDELVARRSRKWRGGIEAAPDLGRVDAKQPHAAERRHVDRVAVEDGAHEHGIRTPKSCSLRCHGCHGSNCQQSTGGYEQELHRELLSAGFKWSRESRLQASSHRSPYLPPYLPLIPLVDDGIVVL